MNIFMLPLDVTNSAMLTKRELESVKSICTPFGTTMHDLLVFYLGSAFALYGAKEPPLHDPCAAFFLVNPSSFEYKLMRVDVELNRNSMCYGQTVVDYYDQLKQKPKNVNVCIKMDVGEFWKSLLDSFKRVDNI
jgi:inosine-uridine nucleoside N-ribohydrolase